MKSFKLCAEFCSYVYTTFSGELLYHILNEFPQLQILRSIVFQLNCSDFKTLRIVYKFT